MDYEKIMRTDNWNMCFFKEWAETFSNMDQNIYNIILSYIPKCIICEALVMNCTYCKYPYINFIKQTSSTINKPYWTRYYWRSIDWTGMDITRIILTDDLHKELDIYLSTKAHYEEISCINYNDTIHIVIFPRNTDIYKYIFITLSFKINDKQWNELQRYVEDDLFEIEIYYA